MQGSDFVARAALVLAATLLAQSLPEGPPAAAECGEPRELRARAAHTTAVVCAAGARAGGPLRGPARLLFGLGIDANRADAATLEVLPGIGPSRADAIVRARGDRPFQCIHDLLAVPGIGPRGLERLRPYLSPDVDLAADDAADCRQDHLQSDKGR